MATTFVELSSNSKEDEEKLREHNIHLLEYLKSTIDGLEGIVKFFPYDLLKNESLVLFIRDFTW